MGVKMFMEIPKRKYCFLLARPAGRFARQMPKYRRKDTGLTPTTASQKVAPDETFPQVLRLYL
jgi:hypothetical protein